MKKLLIVAMTVFATASLSAQEAASSSGSTKKMFLGGSAGFGMQNEKDGSTDGPKSSNWNFGPTFGYYLNEKMALGINLALNGSKTEQNNTKKEIDKYMGWYVEPFFRYYFAGKEKLKFFGELYVGFGGGNHHYEDNTPVSGDIKYGTFGVGVRPGIQYWFNDNWSMFSTIGALSYSGRTDDKGGKDPAGNSTEIKTSNFDLNANFASMNFGIYFHF